MWIVCTTHRKSQPSFLWKKKKKKHNKNKTPITTQKHVVCCSCDCQFKMSRYCIGQYFFFGFNTKQWIYKSYFNLHRSSCLVQADVKNFLTTFQFLRRMLHDMYVLPPVITWLLSYIHYKDCSSATFYKGYTFWDFSFCFPHTKPISENRSI